MNSVQESKQELEAAIRYAENAISSAKQTIESMEFRQEMAKKQSSEKTGREQALERDLSVKTSQAEAWRKEYEEAKKEVQRQQDLGQGYYDNMMTFKAEVEKLRKEKEASSGPCGCQAYRDLEERATMPVIPKAVAIAIFREGVAHGVSNACDEIDNSDALEINETGYTGDFEVSFSKYIDLSEHLDLDWMRDKVGDYDEASVIEALKNLCADKEFECRIHGVDDKAKDSASA
jgi:hypothetical protein